MMNGSLHNQFPLRQHKDLIILIVISNQVLDKASLINKFQIPIVVKHQQRKQTIELEILWI